MAGYEINVESELLPGLLNAVIQDASLIRLSQINVLKKPCQAIIFSPAKSCCTVSRSHTGCMAAPSAYPRVEHSNTR
jgi:hypothetical protein